MTKVLLQPAAIGYVHDQAEAAIGATACVARITGYYSKALLLNAATVSINLEIQLSTQAEYQLRMLMAVNDLVLVVMTQGQDGRHVDLDCKRMAWPAAAESDACRWHYMMTLSRSLSAAWLRAWITRSLSKFCTPLVSRYIENPGNSCSTKLLVAPRSRRKSTT